MAPLSGFPSEQDAPNKKAEKPWLLQYARAAWAEAMEGPYNAIGIKSAARYDTIKAYALGKQDVSQYKKLLSPDQDTEVKLSTNWQILSHGYRFRQAVLGRLRDAEFDIRVDPIDALAATELEEKVARMRAKAILREAFATTPGVEGMAQDRRLAPEPGEPDDLDGIEVEGLSMRHKVAMEAEMVLDWVFNASRFDEIREQLREDYFDCGFGMAHDATEGEAVVAARVDPRIAVISPCIKPDFTDIRHAGKAPSIPIAQLLVMSDGQVTPEDLEAIYQQVSKSNAPGQSYSDWLAKGKVAVLDLEIYSNDEIVREERVNSKGNLRFGPAKDRDRQKDKAKIKRRKVMGVYRCKWVIGTDVIFDYGKQWDVKRDPLNPARAVPSYHIAACGYYDGTAFSHMEAIIPYLDDIQLAHFKRQHALNSAVPSGPVIDLTSLEEIDWTAGGATMSKKDVISLFLSKGVALYRSRPLTGSQGNTGPGIRWETRGIASELAEHQNAINSNMFLIQQTLGLNALTDGSTPNAKTLNGVAALAQAGTSNALSDLYSAERRTVRSLSESVVLRAQDIVRDPNKKATLIIAALGKGTADTLRDAPRLDRYTFGTRIEERPSNDEIVAFRDSLMQAVAQGHVGPDVEMKVKRIAMRSVKQAEDTLAYLVKKAREQKQKEAAMQMQANAQMQQQSALTAEQAKQQTLQLEYSLKIQLVQTEKDLELRNLNTAKQYDLEEERIAASGRTGAAAIQADERATSNMQDNSTKLIKEGREDLAVQLQAGAAIQQSITPQTATGTPLAIQPAGPELFDTAQGFDDYPTMQATQEGLAAEEQLDPKTAGLLALQAELEGGQA